MPDGSMNKGSVSHILYTELLAAYENEYNDDADKDTILAAITANYTHECEVAWQNFLAEIGIDDT